MEDRRDLGNLTMLREDARTVWSWVLLEQLARDVRVRPAGDAQERPVRRRSPHFHALGSVRTRRSSSFMDAILLRALPVSDPGSLVAMQWQSRPPNPAASDQFVMHSMDGSTYDDRSGVQRRSSRFRRSSACRSFGDRPVQPVRTQEGWRRDGADSGPGRARAGRVHLGDFFRALAASRQQAA